MIKKKKKLIKKQKLLKNNQYETISNFRHHFDDTILRFFSQTSGWSIEAANYYLIFYADNTLVPENILAAFYRLAHGVYELFIDKNELPKV